MLFKKKNIPSLTFTVKKMTCGHCEMHLKQALEKIDGVKNAKLDRKNQKAEITFETDKEVPVRTLIDAVIAEGYEATE